MAKVKIGNVFPPDAYLLQRCAPAGFGIGQTKTKELTTADDLDIVKKSGWYRWGEQPPTNAPAFANDSNKYTAMRVDGCDEKNFKQTLISLFGNGYNLEITRQIQDGVYGEWEWPNPPMIKNTEYRTTERWNGLPVYAQMIRLESMPNASQVVTAHGIEGIAYVLEAKGVAVNKSTNIGFPFPCRGKDDTVGTVELYADPTNIVVTTTKDMTNNFGHVALKYIKG